MSRKTVVIGAMKPMTAGHYKLITEAVADTKVPAGEIESNETYVLISIQDRMRKGEMPVHGETALEALRDIYLPTSDFMRFDSSLKKIHLILCHSTKFAKNNPERIEVIKEIVNSIYIVLENNSITNISVKLEEVRSGPPNFLISLAEDSPDDEFILYTGTDDLKKYTYLPKYSSNISFAGFERFEGGLSGTETRRLISQDELSPEEEERFSGVFPSGVDPNAVRSLYRKKAGLEEQKIKNILNESHSIESLLGTEEYGERLDELISQLKDVKGSLGSRKKKYQRYRKEASMLQNAIRSLRDLKRKNQKMLSSQPINENLTRNDIKYFIRNIKG